MHYTIKNIAGVECIFAPMQDSSSITIEVLVKAGSVYENPKTIWLSHFLEHMFFKGGKKYPTKQAVSATLDEIGADYNAFTAKDLAGYFVKSAPDFRETGVDVLADMLVEATFAKEEIDKERTIILEEIKRKNDIPPNRIYVDWTRNYYGDTPHGWPVLWPEEHITSFTQEDFFEHKKNLYTKDNLVVVVAGKIVDQQALEESIRTLFAWLPEKATINPIAYADTHPLGKEDIIEKDIEQANIMFGAPWVGGDDENRYKYDLLANILGGTCSSRLYQEIRENRWLAYSVYAGHAAMQNHGYFVVRAWLTKEKYQEWVDAMKDVLRDIASWNITEQEFIKAKNNIIGSLQMWLETSDEIASFLGRQHLIYKRIKTIDDHINAFKAITLEEIKQVAPIVHPDNFYGCIML